MNKFKPRLLFLTIFIFASILSLDAKAAESTPKTPTKQHTSILQAILSIFKSSEDRFISRNSSMCLISPGNSGQELIWSDRPLFIWQGRTVEPQINLYSSMVNDDSLDEPELIWSETIAPNSQTIAYTGEKLEPGSTYQWEFISHGKPYRQTMVLMEQSQREAISTELTALDNRLKTSKASAEEMAIAKADFFLQHKLGSDALQQLYSVADPDSDLASQIDDFEDRLCK